MVTLKQQTQKVQKMAKSYEKFILQGALAEFKLLAKTANPVITKRLPHANEMEFTKIVRHYEQANKELQEWLAKQAK
jgi:hypothetical protein